MNLDQIKLPKNWYNMKINKTCNLYLNVKDQIASLAPVFELHQCQMLLKDVLGLNIDFALLDKSISKIKNQINLQTN